MEDISDEYLAFMLREAISDINNIFEAMNARGVRATIQSVNPHDVCEIRACPHTRLRVGSIKKTIEL